MPHRDFPKRQRQFVRQLRSNMTDAEHKLWHELRAHRFHGFGFRRQAPLGTYIVDFVCHRANLIIELDGGQHAQKNQIQQDRERANWLELKGYKVLRFWNNDVLKNIDGVLAKIEAQLRESSPSRSGASPRSDLPLKGGGSMENQA